MRDADIVLMSKNGRAVARGRVLVMLVVAALGFAGGTADGATSSTVVGATVPSATFVDAAGCPPLTTGITDFGLVMPGASAVTSSDCTVVFGSSNDSSMLRISQEDAFGVGMWRSTDGDLDTAGFATPNGYVNDPKAGFGTSGGHAMARTDDGGMVVAGGYFVGGGNVHPAILRLDDTGAPVAGFGVATGVAYADVGVVSTVDRFDAVAVQDDGSIVAAGSYEDAAGDERIVVARFSSTGSLDTTGFAAPDGFVLIDTVDGGTVGDSISASQVAIDASGRIVAAGTRSYAGGSRGWIARVLADGSLDTTGCAAPAGLRDSIGFGGSGDDIAALAIAEDGASFLVAGSGGGSEGLVVARYDAQCDLDPSFAAPTGYTIVLANGERSQGYAIVVDPDATVTAFGRTYQPTESMLLVAGLESDGDPDPAFGGGVGYELVDTDDDGWFGATDEYASDAVALPGGGYLAVGTAWNGADYVTRTWQITDSGSLDTTWASGGWKDLPVGVAPNPIAAIDAGDGRIAIVGDTSYNGAGAARIARLGGEQVLDYGAGGTWGSGANVFGACLVSVGAGATTDAGTWTTDGDGDCADGDADPWNAVPSDAAVGAAKVAAAPGGDDDAEAHLRFGFRAATNQAPGTYVAPITFDVVAPDA